MEYASVLKQSGSDSGKWLSKCWYYWWYILVKPMWALEEGELLAYAAVTDKIEKLSEAIYEGSWQGRIRIFWSSLYRADPRTRCCSDFPRRLDWRSDYLDFRSDTHAENKPCNIIFENCASNRSVCSSEAAHENEPLAVPSCHGGSMHC